VPLNTHGEILRDLILSRPNADSYLLLDADAFFVDDGNIATMAAELAADPALFAVQARQCDEHGVVWQGTGDGYGGPGWQRMIRMKYRDTPDQDWWDGADEFTFRIGDRANPFCLLLSNKLAVRRAVDVIGLSPAITQCVRGGQWWDTMGLLTQVMKTHGLSWRYSAANVGHFANVSWTNEWSVEKARRRDVLLSQYAARRG